MQLDKEMYESILLKENILITAKVSLRHLKIYTHDKSVADSFYRSLPDLTDENLENLFIREDIK